MSSIPRSSLFGDSPRTVVARIRELVIPGHNIRVHFFNYAASRRFSFQGKGVRHVKLVRKAAAQ